MAADATEYLRYCPNLVLRRAGNLQLPSVESADGAVLFADISGFSRLGERLQQERGQAVSVEILNRIINHYFEKMIEICDLYGGDVVKFAGDALFVYFSTEMLGATLQCCAWRAVVCGQAIVTATADLAKNPTEYGDFGIVKVHCGVGAGNVRAYFVGKMQSRCEVVIAGEVLPQVSKAESLARADEVVVSPDAWDLIKTYCVGDPVVGDSDTTDDSERSFFLIRSTFFPDSGLDLSVKPRLDVVKGMPPSVGETLRKFIPNAALQYIDNQSALAELRQVAVVFVRINGGLMATGKPFDYDGSQESLDIVQEMLTSVQRAAYQYEGALSRFQVDDKGTVMKLAVGLPPFSHEDDAVRAVLIAFAVRRNLNQLGMTCSIGITIGHVLCGMVGSPLRCEYTTVGATVNLAARFMIRAAKSQVFCSEEVVQACGKRIHFERLPPMKVKGKDTYINVYKALGDLRDKLNGRRLSLQADRGVIGRSEEVTVLRSTLHGFKAEVESCVRPKRSRKRASYRRVIEQASYLPTATAVVLESAAGMGKTCVVKDLLSMCDALGLRTFYSAADSMEAHTDYYCWRSLLLGALTTPASMGLRGGVSGAGNGSNNDHSPESAVPESQLHAHFASAAGSPTSPGGVRKTALGLTSPVSSGRNSGDVSDSGSPQKRASRYSRLLRRKMVSARAIMNMQSRSEQIKDGLLRLNRKSNANFLDRLELLERIVPLKLSGDGASNDIAEDPIVRISTAQPKREHSEEALPEHVCSPLHENSDHLGSDSAGIASDSEPPHSPGETVHPNPDSPHSRATTSPLVAPAVPGAQPPPADLAAPAADGAVSSTDGVPGGVPGGQPSSSGCCSANAGPSENGKTSEDHIPLLSCTSADQDHVSPLGHPTAAVGTLGTTTGTSVAVDHTSNDTTHNNTPNNGAPNTDTTNNNTTNNNTTNSGVTGNGFTAPVAPSKEDSLLEASPITPGEAGAEAGAGGSVSPRDKPTTALPRPTLTRSPTHSTREMHEYVLAILQAVCEEGPCVFVIDNGQWMDFASWDLLAEAAETLRGVMFLIAMRPFVGTDSVPSAFRAIVDSASTTVISLSAMDDNSINELVCSKIGATSVAPEVLDFILTNAEHQPFYSEQLARKLLADGIVRVRNGVCDLVNSDPEVLNSVSLPDSMQGIITAKLAKLRVSQQFLLKLASVLGCSFDGTTLMKIHPNPGMVKSLSEDLLCLERAGFLEPLNDDMTYVFRHSPDREVVYNLMTFAQRKTLHLLVAEWFERTCGGRSADLSPLLSYHYEMGCEFEKACKYYDMAARDAISHSAHFEAQHFLQKALELSNPDKDKVQREVWRKQLVKALSEDNGGGGYAGRRAPRPSAVTRSSMSSTFLESRDQSPQPVIGSRVAPKKISTRTCVIL
eukprot:Rmarinus@m.5624